MWFDRSCRAQGQCTCSDARGLEVSPGSLGQDLFIDGQIGNGLPEMLILPLELLQLLELVRSNPTILLPPPVIGLLRDTHLPDRINRAIP